MPFQFPDPSVSTTATLPNGEKWEYVDGAWRAVRLTDNDQQQIDDLVTDDEKQAAEILDLQQAGQIDRHLLLNISGRVDQIESDLSGIQGLDLTNALSALAIAQQDIIELKSKVNTLELTSFLIME